MTIRRALYWSVVGPTILVIWGCICGAFMLAEFVVEPMGWLNKRFARWSLR